MSAWEPAVSHNNRRFSIAIASLAAFVAAGAPAAQAQHATAPAASATAPTGEALVGTITAVDGMVQVRLGEDEPWQSAGVGMKIGPGAAFRTGPRSAVRFVFPPGQTITLDRLGTVTVLEALRTEGRIKMDVGMDYGRLRYDIEAAGQEHDATIHTPGSTLAVRGTDVIMFNQGFYPVTATSVVGTARFRDLDGSVQTFGGEQQAVIVSGSGGAAQTALGLNYVDPSSIARGAGEAQALRDNPSISGFTFGTTFTSSLALPPVAPAPVVPANFAQGSLVFQLVWVNSEPSSLLPDLDLFVRSPLGELLDPKLGPPVVPSGGRSPLDDRGGAANRAGQEVAAWPDLFPLGRYEYGVTHISGAGAEYQLVVIRDGRVVGDAVGGSLDSQNNRDSYEVSIGGSSGLQTAGRSNSASAVRAARAAPARAPTARPIGPYQSGPAR